MPERLTLFRFEMTKSLGPKDMALLHEDLGLEWTGDKPGFEEAEAPIGDFAYLYLSSGDHPDTWIIEALGRATARVDQGISNLMAQRVRNVLATITDDWKESD